MTNTNEFASLTVFEAYLEQLGQFRMQLGLERVLSSLRALAHATAGARSTQTVARVVGTNGKGTTSWLLARLAAAHGLRVGLFTSPHFISPRERIMILDTQGARMATDSEWLELANTVYAAGPVVPTDYAGEDMRCAEGLSYFEYLTVMAAEFFGQQGVDVAVYEAGLGARWDATAALGAHLACITRIGLDHEHILGKGVAAIAKEKGHALRQGARLGLASPQTPEAWGELERASQEGGTPLMAVNLAPATTFDPAPHLGMMGGHQAQNARLAMAAWRVIAGWRGVDVEEELCRRVCEHAALPGRLQSVAAVPGRFPYLLLDGAHNEDAFLALQSALTSANIRPRAVVAAFMADKDMKEVAPVLAALATGAPVYLPALSDIPRAAAPETAAAILEEHGCLTHPMPHLAAAMDALKDMQSSPQRPVLLCGSLFLLGEFFKLRPETLVWQ